MDEETERSWRVVSSLPQSNYKDLETRVLQLLQLTRKHLIEGISIQRNGYLKQAITPQEHTEIMEVHTLFSISNDKLNSGMVSRGRIWIGRSGSEIV